MRFPITRVLTASAVACAVLVAGTALGRADDFQISYAAGSRDEAGRFAGGTEMRLLTPHGGRLYAGNGYWEDRPGPEGPQGAQILVLDAPGGRWRVDHAFEERLPNGRWRDLAVGALTEAVFATDGAGRTLPRSISLLLASTWDLTGAARVFARDVGPSRRLVRHYDGAGGGNCRRHCGRPRSWRRGFGPGRCRRIWRTPSCNAYMA